MKREMFLYAFFALLLASGVSALEFSAAAQKTVFVKDENVVILATVENDAGVAKTFVVEVNVRGGGLPPAPVRVPVLLEAGESKTVNVSALFVDDGVPPGDYEARVRLLDAEVVVSEASASFRVEGTLERISDFEVFACADEACARRSAVYYKGGIVFLKYASATEGLSVSAVVKTPSGEKTIALPASLVLDAKGIHVVTVTAAKSGFKSVVKQIEFSVLEKPVTLVEERGLAGEAPTVATPLKPSGEGRGFDSAALYAIVLVVALAVAAAVSYWFFRKKRKRRAKK